MTREQKLAWAAWVTICLVWGTTYLAIRVALETIPVFLVAGLRWMAAGLALGAFSVVTGRRLPGPRMWGGLALLAAIGGGVVFALLGYDPLVALATLFLAPLSTLDGLTELGLKATPLLLCAIGIAVGCAAAALKGFFDEIVMRASDVVFAFPAVLSAIMIGALMGSGPLSAVLAIAVFNVPVFARVSRGVALQVWTFDYIAAARSIGKHPIRITFEDVLPNIAGLLVVQCSVNFGIAVLAEAGLSFLGLGTKPPTPSWGRMLQDSQQFLGAYDYLAIVPGLAIAIAVLGFNLLGDGLRDRFDPKMRNR